MRADPQTTSYAERASPHCHPYSKSYHLITPNLRKKTNQKFIKILNKHIKLKNFQLNI